MTLLIYPNVDIWQYAVESLQDCLYVKCFALNNYTNIFQQATRKMFSDKHVPSRCLLGKFLRRELASLSEKDKVVVADYTDICLIHAISDCMKNNARRILWLWNPLKSMQNVVENIREIKESGFEIHTFDENDAQRYSLCYNNQFFPISYHLNDSRNIDTTDFYFAGFRKDRGALITEIKSSLESYRTNFIVADTIADCIPYRDYIEQLKRSKCLVEIVQGQQSGITLRPLEAITFQKKLLTTNIDIVKHPFYHKNNIFIWGVDNINKIETFLNTPYFPLGKTVLSPYDITTWINVI